jgi:hypothetical protein
MWLIALVDVRLRRKHSVLQNLHVRLTVHRSASGDIGGGVAGSVETVKDASLCDDTGDS